MKRYLIGSLVLAGSAGFASSSAWAQSAVTVYGALDAGITYANNSGPNNGNTVRMDTGTLYGNRVGFRGVEDLGGGNRAIFLTESGFALDNGASTQGGLLFGRQSYVGLESNYGTLTVGRQYTLDLELAPYHAFVASRVNNFAGISHWVDRLGDRVDNSLRYKSPVMNGFTVAALIGLGEKAGSQSASRTLNGAVNYVNGPLAAGATYLRINDANGDRLTGVAVIDGQYTFGATTLHLAYTDTHGVAANSLCFSTCAANSAQIVRTYETGVDYQLNATNRVYGGGALTKFTDGLSGKALQYNLAAFHTLSKRTELYSLFSLTKTTGLDGFARAAFGTPDFGATAFVTNPQGTANKASQMALRVGMTHRF
ncbi:porin [Glaciimonas sp. PCH181]|uniref:porin n=1 Tax=Glaciimonas sp. PCH181 TaxID=2133943 RepID=UPI001374F8C1|nr:porin [Glaciimonas sp. PCH181]